MSQTAHAVARRWSLVAGRRTSNQQPATSNPEDGFSLVEAMVAVGVFAIIGAAIVAAAGAGHQFWAVGDAADQVQMNFRRALGYLEEDLKEAKEGYTTVGSGGTSGSYVTFKVPVDLADGSANGVLKPDGTCCDWGAKPLSGASTAKYVRYALEQSSDDSNNYQLKRCIVSDTTPGVSGHECTQGPGAEDVTPVANRIKANSLTFTKSAGSRLVTVQLTTEKKARTTGTSSDSGWKPTLVDQKAQIMLRN